jgi:hemerythrin superfamily protein
MGTAHQGELATDPPSTHRETSVTSTQLAGGRDVVAFLVNQHQQIKDLFAQVSTSRGDERQQAFTALRRLLAVHETAEEEVVHPRARKELSDGEEVVDARLQEENEAKQTLATLESLDIDSTEFEKLFQELQADVLNHAAAEEQQEFGRLADELDPDQLERMRRAVELAEATAPTRPHPGVESAKTNMLAGPFASMLDRARDMLTGKTDDAG